MGVPVDNPYIAAADAAATGELSRQGFAALVRRAVADALLDGLKFAQSASCFSIAR